MARRVKKTDSREVDHWVSTDDGRHLPIDKDGNIIFGSSKKSTSKSGSNKRKTYKKNGRELKPAFDMKKYGDTTDEERAMDLVDSKNYIGDKEITKQVKDQLKDFGQASSVTVDSVEVSRWDGKSDKGYVEATYTLKGVEHGGRKTNQTFTEEFVVNVRKSEETTSKSSSSDKSKNEEASTKKLTRKQKVLNDEKVQNLLNTAKSSWGEGVFKDSDGEEFEIGYETDEYYNIYQTSDGQRFDESRVQRMVEGQDSGKYRAWNNWGQLLVTSSARAAVKHAWGTPKEAGIKREAPKEYDTKKPTSTKKDKPASSKTNKVRQLMGNNKNLAEWKINRAYDKTSLKKLALDAGVPSSKVRTMSTEELRAMLLSMWKGK